MKTIGIVGGMGPLAGVDLHYKILDQTLAGKDQEHLDIVHVALPGIISDRTRFLQGKAPNPAGSILEVLGRLEVAGAHIAGIPCNTAHAAAIWEVVQLGLSERGAEIQLVSMIKETASFCIDTFGHSATIGLLATQGATDARV